MRLAIFPVHLSKVLRLPRKIDARSYEVLHLSRKIILANLHIWYSKMQPLSGNHCPDLLTALMNMSLVVRLPRKMHLCKPSSNVPHLPSFLEMPQNPHVLPTFDKVQNPLRLPRETTSEPPKVVRTPSVLYIFTSKCASRHNGVHFFDISTAKSGPHLVCVCTFSLRNVLHATTACTFSTSQLPKVVRTWCVFVHFRFDMCFAPQRRALFRHRNFQKRSDTEVFCTFSLWHVLRATTACTFSTSQLPKVVRDPRVLYLFTSKSASRHNGVQFFISHLASWLRTRRFSEPTFRPSGATNHWKNTGFRDFPTFSCICIFFLLTTLSLLHFSLLIFLFSLPLPYSAFHLSILSEVWLLNFLRSLIHWFIWFNGRFTDSLLHWFVDSLVYWSIDSLINDSLVHWFIGALLHCFIAPLIHWFIDPLIRSFNVDSLIHWFILVHWFIQSAVCGFFHVISLASQQPCAHSLVQRFVASASQKLSYIPSSSYSFSFFRNFRPGACRALLI